MIMDMREDRSEILHYDIPDYPVFFRNNVIPGEYDFHEEFLHWHDEVELIYVYEGSVNYQVNGDHIHMDAGQGIFVNSRQVHVIFSDHKNCKLYCLIFHPTLMCASSHVAKTYVQPLINDEAIPYVKLSEALDWQKRVLKYMEAIQRNYEKAEEDLVILQNLYGLWNQLAKNLMNHDQKENVKNDNLTMVKKMMAYIQNHYKEKISLMEICQAGMVGKTKGTSLFSKYLNMTPIEYLKGYRIEQSYHLLEKTDLSIAQIAMETGFTDSSYYSKIFHEKMGISPKEYRRRFKEHHRQYKPRYKEE